MKGEQNVNVATLFSGQFSKVFHSNFPRKISVLSMFHLSEKMSHFYISFYLCCSNNFYVPLY